MILEFPILWINREASANLINKVWRLSHFQ